MKQPTVLLVFGGESSEHDVSVSSARNVYGAMNPSEYDVLLCYIDTKGKWWRLPEWSDQPDTQHNVQISVTPGSGQLITEPNGHTLMVDALFPVLHGKYGEDGTIQGLAELVHIPIVGCGVEASAIGMNKAVTKQLAATKGIPVVPWVTLTSASSEHDMVVAAQSISVNGPWFVKPARAGSSIGVSKVTNVDGIYSAVDLALQHDDTVLIETAVIGRELEVAVLGNPPTHVASGVGEIIAGSEFYDYDDKYSNDSASKVVLTAELSDEMTQTIRRDALEAYALIGCRGLARVDFLLSDDGTAYLNEINTLPGFTDISMYPKLWQQAGVSYSELVDRLIKLALVES